MKAPQTEFGRRIRLERQRCGWTQGDVAHRLGITPQAMQQLESGAIAAPRITHVVELARLFAVSSDYLLGLSAGRQQTATVRKTAAADIPTVS